MITLIFTLLFSLASLTALSFLLYCEYVDKAHCVELKEGAQQQPLFDLSR